MKQGDRTALIVLLLSAYPAIRLSAQDDPRISEAQAVLSQLVESYGVSGAEGPVRETVKRLLPAWANAETDTAGNLWLRVGQGDRSEEHTSELQSRSDLVCRLL